MKTLLKCAIVVVALTTALSTVYAQTGSLMMPDLCNFEEWAQQVKNPTPWLTWGADLRIRDEYLPNTVTLTDKDPLAEQNVARFRARVWGTAKMPSDVSFNARLSAEPRLFTEPAGFGPRKTASGMEWRYGILDNVNLKWNNAFQQPLTITVGRQDIMLGDFYDWWLVADGTPGDGSWTFFLDSVRLTYDAKNIDTKFDVITILQHARADEWIPTIGNPTYSDWPRFNDTEHPLTEQNETGVIAYLSNKSLKNTAIDAYFIYKRDDQETMERGGFPWIPGDNADIFTFGGKISGNITPNWQYSLEGAYQFGNKEDRILGVFADRDISAYGAKAKLTYLFKDKLNNQLFVSGEFLSGDDPSTPGTDEMFDVLWGRWPRWSELYIYSYAGETSGKIAQMNNLMRFGPCWTFNPTKGMTFSVAYNALFAQEEVPTRAVAPRFSNNGDFRGHFLQTVLKHQFNKHLSAHIWVEFVWQGDYYARRDVMGFVRPEILFTF